MTSFKLSRRAMLRGLGAAVALPILDAMLDSRGLLHGVAHAGAPVFPVRLFTFFFPNGTWNKLNYPSGQPTLDSAWVPTVTGTSYTMTPALMPLAEFRDDLTIVSGLNNVEGNGHETGMPTFANGAVPSGNVAGGPSIDQIAVDHFRPTTAFSSLAISLSSDCNMREPRQRALSWRSNSQGITHVPWESDPRALFQSLFPASGTGTGTPMPDATAREDGYRRSILDFVQQDAGRLRTRLGRSDRARLDEHLTAVREIEARLAGGSGPGGPVGAMCGAIAAPAELTSGPAGPVCASGTNPWTDDVAAPLMARMLALAIKCDLVRYGSFGIGDTNYSVMVPWIAPGKNEHMDIAHSNTDRDLVVLSTQWKMSVFAALLRELKNSPEGNGTALDNCMIFCGSNMSDGQLHNNVDMPIVVAGRAGGAFTPGRHARYQGRQTRELFGSLLSYAGVPASSFPSTLSGTLAGF